MKKVLLTEQKVGTLEYLKESAEKKDSTVLGKLRGVCAECDAPTRNGRTYSKQLWEKVLSSDTFKEYLNTKCLFGELNHPEDRLDTDISKAAVALRDVSIQENLVIGTFDILPTPCGEILKTLCDYGSQLGVSSRGGGDVIMKEGKEYVDENSYDFVAFDVVALPAVRSARPQVIESVEIEKNRNGLKESILNQIEKSSDSEVRSIKSVLEKIDLPDKQLIMESIENKIDAVGGETISPGVLEDLQKTLQKLDESESKNAELMTKLSAGTTRETKLEGDLSKVQSSLKTVAERLKKSTAKETVQSKVVESLKQKIENLESNNKTLNERMSVMKSSSKLITEARKADTTELLETKSKLETAKSRLSEALSTLKSVEEEKNQKIESQSKIIESLNKDKTILESRCEKSIKSIKEELTSKERLSEDAISRYISLFCRYNNLDESQIVSRISNLDSIKSVDKALSEATDYKLRIEKLPFSVSDGKHSIQMINEEAEHEKKSTTEDNSQLERMLMNLKQK